MKLKFETWIEENSFSDDAKNLFDSAVKCYKADVNTAALLMSYIGFLVVLKVRILSANTPPIFIQANWDSILKNLINEDKWEEQVFTAAMQMDKFDGQQVKIQSSVFAINDNLRTQIRFWKDRRNDCAHNKDNVIMQAHVESFWSFLQSNLPKMTVEGGRASLVNKFQRHFDTTYTSASTDVTPLVAEIRNAVEKNELDMFWDEMFQLIGDVFNYSNEIKVIDKVFMLNDQSLSTSLIKFVKNYKKLFDEYISEQPSKLSFFLEDPQDIRRYWKSKIMQTNVPLKIYASMLRNSLIPADEIAEANEQLAKSERYSVEPQDILILQQNGFEDAIFKRLFVDQDTSHYKYWKFINEHVGQYIFYLANFPLTDEAVKILATQLNKSTFRPQFLENDLNQLFLKDPNKRKEFLEKITSLNLDWPVGLK